MWTTTVWALLAFSVKEVASQTYDQARYRRDLIVTIATASGITLFGVVLVVWVGYICYNKELKKIRNKLTMRMLINKENRSDLIETPVKLATVYEYLKQHEEELALSLKDSDGIEKGDERENNKAVGTVGSFRALDVIFTTESERKRLLDLFKIPEKVRKLYDEKEMSEYEHYSEHIYSGIEEQQEETEADKESDTKETVEETAIDEIPRPIELEHEPVGYMNKDNVSEVSEKTDFLNQQETKADKESYPKETVEETAIDEIPRPIELEPEPVGYTNTDDVSEMSEKTDFLNQPDIESYFFSRPVSRKGKKKRRRKKAISSSANHFETLSSEFFDTSGISSGGNRKKSKSRKTKRKTRVASGKSGAECDGEVRVKDTRTKISSAFNNKHNSNFKNDSFSDRKRFDKGKDREWNVSTMDVVPMYTHTPSARPCSGIRSATRCSSGSQHKRTLISVSDIGFNFRK